MHSEARPVGGPILTRGVRLLLVFGAVAVALLIWRFAMGLGAATALSQGYPWGLWIAFDVVTGTALACGGYAMALMVYVFNRGKYHPLVRPAILTSALGYTLAALAVAIDVGRPWVLWKVPLMIWRWNVSSVLLEVAVCIMSYVLVLWIELSPAILERWSVDGREGLRRFAQRTLPLLDKSLFTIVAIGVILPTLHQSSLGSLMLIGGPKLHLLWNTRFLPMYFLLTCIAMGYAMVVFEAAFSHRAFGSSQHRPMLAQVQGIAAWLCALFVVARVGHLIVRGNLADLFRFEFHTILFWIESVLFLVPIVLLFTRRETPTMGSLLREAMVLMFAGALYRFDTFLLAFDPGPGWHYFPSVAEILITVGLVALELAAYIALVRKFPILSGSTRTADAYAPVAGLSPSVAQ